jgi:hypothetical protein
MFLTAGHKGRTPMPQPQPTTANVPARSTQLEVLIEGFRANNPEPAALNLADWQALTDTLIVQLTQNPQAMGHLAQHIHQQWETLKEAPLTEATSQALQSELLPYLVRVENQRASEWLELPEVPQG